LQETTLDKVGTLSLKAG